MTSEAMTATVHRSWAADLEPRSLYDLLRVRVDVFVVEQASPYSELDGRDLDDDTRHFWLGGEGRPEPVLGTVRVLEEPDRRFRIGRLCITRSARGRGLGRRLLQAALAEVGDRPCVLDSQEHLAGFYGSHGFAATGPVYDWDGVAHVPMQRG